MSLPGLTRAASLAAASGVALLLMLFPYALGPELGGVERTGLFALLFGVSGAFVHGFGYTPQRRIWRLAFSPAAAWSLMIAGALLLSLRSA